MSSSARKRAPRAGLSGGRHRSYPVAERLAARTEPQPNGCWIFRGARVGKHGYGQITIDRATNKRGYAHRVAWELKYGPVPKGLEVCHNCPTGDNPLCVNPAHLFLGTHQQNIHDAIYKGRFNAFGRQRLTAANVREIRKLGARGLKHKDIAARFGVARHSVTGILNGRSWQHLDRPFVLGSGNSVFERVPHVDRPITGEIGA